MAVDFEALKVKIDSICSKHLHTCSGCPLRSLNGACRTFPILPYNIARQLEKLCEQEQMNHK